MDNKLYYIEGDSFYILKDELNKKMKELEEDEFAVWFQQIYEEAKKEQAQ